MSVKLVYTVPAVVKDSLDATITDPAVLAALAGLSCVEETVLAYLSAEIPDRDAFTGGYVRLTTDGAGKPLRVTIEIDSPRKLTRNELKALRDDLDGQVSDGIGKGAFDFLDELAELGIDTFAPGSRKSSIVQSAGNAWVPRS